MKINELFIELANPNEFGVSRWVYVTEFIDKYKGLKFGNGGSWTRPTSALSKKYVVETDKSITPGNSIDAVRLNGFNSNTTFNQHIRRDIKEHYKDHKCVMLGVNGISENTKRTFYTNVICHEISPSFFVNCVLKSFTLK